VAGASQQQAAAEHEPACGRGGCGRGKGVRACERAQLVGACVMAGRGRGERAAGVGARRGLCEGMQVSGGGAVTDGGLRVVGRGCFGVFMLRGGVRYEGDLVDNKMTGRGIYSWANGRRYEGDFIDGKRHGRGIFTFANKDR
jgi:hypothetical protein